MLSVNQLVKKFPAFHRTWKFITISKEPATGPFPEPQQSTPHPPYFHNIHFNIIIPAMHRFSKWSLPFRLSRTASIIKYLLHKECLHVVIWAFQDIKNNTKSNYHLNDMVWRNVLTHEFHKLQLCMLGPAKMIVKYNGKIYGGSIYYSPRNNLKDHVILPRPSKVTLYFAFFFLSSCSILLSRVKSFW